MWIYLFSCLSMECKYLKKNLYYYKKVTLWELQLILQKQKQTLWSKLMKPKKLTISHRYFIEWNPYIMEKQSLQTLPFIPIVGRVLNFNLAALNSRAEIGQYYTLSLRRCTISTARGEGGQDLAEAVFSPSVIANGFSAISTTANVRRPRPTTPSSQRR